MNTILLVEMMNFIKKKKTIMISVVETNVHQ